MFSVCLWHSSFCRSSASSNVFCRFTVFSNSDFWCSSLSLIVPRPAVSLGHTQPWKYRYHNFEQHLSCDLAMTNWLIWHLTSAVCYITFCLSRIIIIIPSSFFLLRLLHKGFYFTNYFVLELILITGNRPTNHRLHIRSIHHRNFNYIHRYKTFIAFLSSLENNSSRSTYFLCIIVLLDL